MFVKLCYWHYSGDRGLQVLSLRTACWPALTYRKRNTLKRKQVNTAKMEAFETSYPNNCTILHGLGQSFSDFWYCGLVGMSINCYRLVPTRPAYYCIAFIASQTQHLSEWNVAIMYKTNILRVVEVLFFFSSFFFLLLISTWEKSFLQSYEHGYWRAYWHVI